jgi:hypothetical protein
MLTHLCIAPHDDDILSNFMMPVKLMNAEWIERNESIYTSDRFVCVQEPRDLSWVFKRCFACRWPVDRSLVPLPIRSGFRLLDISNDNI